MEVSPSWAAAFVVAGVPSFDFPSCMAGFSPLGSWHDRPEVRGTPPWGTPSRGAVEPVVWSGAAPSRPAGAAPVLLRSQRARPVVRTHRPRPLPGAAG